MKTAEEINVNNDGGNVGIYHLIIQYIFIVMHVVARLVKALRYEPEGCGFGSWQCHWDFSLT
jgi:hypothetical protein